MLTSLVVESPRRVRRLAVVACSAVVLLLLMMVGCGRSSLEPEQGGQGGGGTACNVSTCPTGCCGSDGTCRSGKDVNACGAAGERCSNCTTDNFDICTSSGACARQERSCSSRNCEGCCGAEDGVRLCLSGTAGSACGESGRSCTDCAEQGRACNADTRACGSRRCNASNCDGCCVGDQCLAGTSSTSCGVSGAQCTSCAVGQVCSRGTCAGKTSCGPDNCKGCCDLAGNCLTGDSNTACGMGGEFCSRCSGSQSCNGNSCQDFGVRCGPDNCDGCCAGDSCIEKTSTSACGIKGKACTACKKGQLCTAAGTCEDDTSTCNADNCGGCCVGNFCATGLENTACGTKGGLCQNCVNQGGTCSAGGVCTAPPCGPDTCPKGCCSNNKCITTGADSACGIGGLACENCSSSGETCRSGQCVEKCGPSNCAGCCRANNTCDTLGIFNNSCGQNGAACENCSSSGSFCNGLVSPRQCNNKQTTCPAPYGTCGNSVRTPITAPLQKVCTQDNLDDVATACVNGAYSAACISAISSFSTDCAICLARFNHPFEEKTGLYACAASGAGLTCRHSMGCATECAQTSCNQCSDSSESQCYSLVNSSGQCSAFDSAAASCAAGALAGGVCSQFSYGNYGQWLRGVGDVFCGDGP